MATNNILQILVFSLFAGRRAFCDSARKGAPLVRGADALAEMMLQITGYVMRFAPFAVFGASGQGGRQPAALAILGTYVELVAEFYHLRCRSCCGRSCCALGVDVPARKRIWTLIRYIREPMLIAFSTASSEAALPKLFEQLDRFGVPRRAFRASCCRWAIASTSTAR
ncbi:MAG: cation:dicarboxylase symporter family transporter [Verrucomicrobiota bacterium]